MKNYLILQLLGSKQPSSVKKCICSQTGEVHFVAEQVAEVRNHSHRNFDFPIHEHNALRAEKQKRLVPMFRLKVSVKNLL